jgi:hypothetical protein
VSSSEPGIEALANLRPLTSTSVSTMMAKSAQAASTPHSVASSFFNGWAGYCSFLISAR